MDKIILDDDFLKHKMKLFEKIEYTPQPFQLKVAQSVARFRTISAGVQSGKTFLGAPELLAYVMFFPILAWVVAPDYELTEVIRTSFEAYVNNYFPFLHKSIDGKKKTHYLSNGSTVQYKSAKYERSLKSKGVDFILVEEGKDIRNFIWQMYLESRLAKTKGHALIITEPIDSQDCWVLPLFNRGVPGVGQVAGYESFQWDTSDNSFVDKAEIERQKREKPERVWRSKFVGGVHNESGKLFSHIKMEGQMLPYQEGCRYVAGLDIGQKHSFTTHVILNTTTRRVDWIERYNHATWDYIIKRIHSCQKSYKNPLCNTDAAGVGSKVFEDMQKIGINCKDGSVNALRRRNELIENLALSCEKEDPTFCEYDPAKIEFGAIEFGYTKNGFPIYRPVSGITDDIVIAAALADEIKPEARGDSAEEMRGLQVRGERTFRSPMPAPGRVVDELEGMNLTGNPDTEM